MAYSPASTLITNLPQSQATYFDKDFIANLKANTPFMRCIERRELPAGSGNTHKLYMYQAFAQNIVGQVEGTVGTGILPVVASGSATIGQLADYCNVSDIALETAIDPALENLEREIAFRLALSLNTIVRNVTDGAFVVDATCRTQKASGSAAKITDLMAAVQSLRGRSVKPFDQASGKFVGCIHPFTVGDIMNDTANNSAVDIYKHTVDGLDRLKELPGDDVVQALEIFGMKFYETNTVLSTPNYLAGGTTALRTYLFGNQGVIGISLGVKENAMIGEGDWNNMKVWINKYDTASVSDPSRVIGGSVAYNVKFTATLPPDTTMRVRLLDATALIS